MNLSHALQRKVTEVLKPRHLSLRTRLAMMHPSYPLTKELRDLHVPRPQGIHVEQAATPCTFGLKTGSRIFEHDQRPMIIQVDRKHDHVE